MKHEFTLEFWEDDGWFVGKLKEVPGVFSQGETLQELEQNIADAYQLISQDDQMDTHPPAHTKGIFLSGNWGQTTFSRKRISRAETPRRREEAETTGEMH